MAECGCRASCGADRSWRAIPPRARPVSAPPVDVYLTHRLTDSRRREFSDSRKVAVAADAPQPPAASRPVPLREAAGRLYAIT